MSRILCIGLSIASALIVTVIVLIAVLGNTSQKNNDEFKPLNESDNFMWRHMPAFASGGFSNPITVERGKIIDFFLANEETNACPMYISVARQKNIIYRFNNCSDIFVNHPSSSCNRTLGCYGWKKSFSFTVPSNWISELYVLYFGKNTVYFVVTHHDPIPNVKNPILIPLPLGTGGLGYNEYTGGSYYAYANEKYGTTRSINEQKDANKDPYLRINFRRPVVQSSTPYDPENVLSKNSKIITFPLQWTFPTLSPEILKRAVYVAESDIGVLGEKFLSHFSIMMVVSKQEYIPLESIEALEKWVHNGGHIYLNGCEFSWFTLEKSLDHEGNNILGGLRRSAGDFEGYNKAFSAYNWDKALKYYRDNNRFHLVDWSGTRHVVTTNSPEYLNTVVSDHYLSKCVKQMKVYPYFSTFASLSYNNGRWCFTNKTSDLLGVQVDCDNVKIIQVGDSQFEDGPAAVKAVSGRRWRGVIRHGKGTVFQAGGGYESPECEIAWLQRYDSGKNMLG